ncbi:MAG: PSD1 and planctomycete cytochrome C domain-containing protein [Akkermansiaceae bacterium]
MMRNVVSIDASGSDSVMKSRICKLLGSWCLLSVLILPANGAVDFEKEILPILEESCFDCHGPDKQKGELRLDSRVSLLKGGDTGFPAIVPGDAAKSQMVHFIKGENPDELMPPKGAPLDKEEIALIEGWINEGANWPGQMSDVVEVKTDHWSFQSIVRPEIPLGSDQPIDALLNAKLKEVGLVANKEADPRSLIRRLSIVLTGLPPTPERVSQFITDSNSDGEAAYAELVDDLLASPHFGERWSQHWLDAIRWAETNGSEANLYRKRAWTYRDYVTRSFNEDLPYDRFILEQLAGDRLGVGEATGFLVAGPHVPAATVGREETAIRQARADRLDEVMQTVGASMMGLTVSCARCHNHKFDPVSIQDYYALTAVFQGVEFGGRHPEINPEHPQKKAANQLWREISKEREILRSSGFSWEEDWGGYLEFQFKPLETKVIRLEFLTPSVFIDEMEFFGPADYNRNLALQSRGTALKSDPEMVMNGGRVEVANDGEYGTMMWKAKAPQGSREKPWVEFHFPDKLEVNRFRISGNREYFFETDYLDKTGGKPPGFAMSILHEDGTWLPVTHTKHASNRLKADPIMKAAHQRIQGLIERLNEEGPRHSFIAKFIDPVVTKVLFRGSPEDPRDEVAPAGVAILDGDLGMDSSTPESERRQKFAEWLIRPDHPLTSRVMMNRVWHHLFGTGIVPTGADFGLAGAPPSHPELLDYLAAEFIQQKWSTKTMIRQIVMTNAFRRSSLPQSRGLEVDAGTYLLWRFPPKRVEAEVIRDGILQASGKLDRTIGGRSYRIHNVKATYAQWEVVDNHGPHTWRRMLYQERMRRVDDQIFTAFDFPDCGQVRAKRPVSTTPLQALNLLNSPFVVEQSEFIAERAIQEAGNRLEDSVKKAFELLLARQPSEAELKSSVAVASEHGLQIVCRSLINSNEFAFLP